MKKTISILSFSLALIVSVFFSPFAGAQPYGKGLYGIVQYGDETSLSIATNGNVNITGITPLSTGTLATDTSNVTVTSTDVIGFKLYVRSDNSTDMDNLGDIIPTSGNGTLNPLAINTWGYNINGSANFKGMSLTDVEVKSISGPASAGNLTVFTYGIYVDLEKPAGNYTTSVVYTAVPQTD